MSRGDDLESGSSLHLLFNHAEDSMDTCRCQLRAGDSLVLLNTAVLCLLQPEWSQTLPANIRVYALAADLEAHGLGEIAPGNRVERIDDEGWARLVMSHAHCLSWK